MRLVSEILNKLNEYFPFDTALSYDNVGLLVGNTDREVTKVMVALDASACAAIDAQQEGAQLLITHHPVIFREIKTVTNETFAGCNVILLIEGGISCIALHTNYDRAKGGNNESFARRLGAEEFTSLEDGFATEFDLAEELYFDDFTELVQEITEDPVIRTIRGSASTVKRVIAACGAGISEELIFRAAKNGATIVTADVKHNYATMIHDLGVSLVEPTHYGSEKCFVEDMCAFMREHFPDLEVVVSSANNNPYDD